MRKSHEMTIDRVLLLYALSLAEPYGLLSDVKLQQLCFLCELQLGKRIEYRRTRCPYKASHPPLQSAQRRVERTLSLERGCASGSDRCRPDDR